MKPELEARKIVHSMGYRYRLPVKTLPGRPDLVFPSRRKIIQVNGCFWHQHSDVGCKIARKPKSDTADWTKKLKNNAARDARHARWFNKEGWGVLTLWECKLIDKAKLTTLVERFLDRKKFRASGLAAPLKNRSDQLSTTSCRFGYSGNGGNDLMWLRVLHSLESSLLYLRPNAVHQSAVSTFWETRD